MAVVTEASTWEASIYELEIDDPVSGGPEGLSNKAAQQLANRTKYLKDRALQSNPALGAYTAGDLFYATGAGVLGKLGIGAANRVLTSSGSAPQWADALNLPGQIQGGTLRSLGSILACKSGATDFIALDAADRTTGLLTLNPGVTSRVLQTARFTGLVLATESRESYATALYLVNHQRRQVLLLNQTTSGNGDTFGVGGTSPTGTFRLYVDVTDDVLKITNGGAGFRDFEFMLFRVSNE